jgi:hypothetical protein
MWPFMTILLWLFLGFIALGTVIYWYNRSTFTLACFVCGLGSLFSAILWLCCFVAWCFFGHVRSH